MPSKASVVLKALAPALAEQATADSEDLVKECRECKAMVDLDPVPWVAKADLEDRWAAKDKEDTAAVKADTVACRMACKPQVRGVLRPKARVRAATAVKEATEARLVTAAAATKVVDMANSPVSSLVQCSLPISVTSL